MKFSIRASLSTIVQPGSLGANAATLAAGTVAGQLVNILVSPLIGRLYTPADVGAFEVLFAIFGFVTVIASFRYEFAIITADNTIDAAHLTVNSVIIAACTSILFSLALLVLIKTNLLGLGNFPAWVCIFGIGIIFAISAFNAMRFWMMRHNRFSEISRLTFLQSLGRATGQVLLGLFGLGYVGLLIGELVGRLVGLSGLFQRSSVEIKAVLSPYQLSVSLLALKTNKQFPFYSLPSSAINAFVAAALLPIVGLFFGLTNAGYLALLVRIIGIPANIVGNAIGDSFHQRIAHLARNKDPRILAVFVKTALLLALFSTVLGVALAIFGPALIPLLFGSSWQASGEMAPLVVPWLVSGLIVSPLSRLIMVVGNQAYKLIYDVVTVLVLLGAFWGGYVLGLTFQATIALYSGATFFSYLVFFLILSHVVAKASGQFRNDGISTRTGY